MVAAAAAPSAATRPGETNRRTPPDPAGTGTCSPADRVGGLNTSRASPATTMQTPTPSSATVVDTWVATTTPSAGPAMNDSSTPIESSE